MKSELHDIESQFHVIRSELGDINSQMRVIKSELQEINLKKSELCLYLAILI
jgi:hypothetical protein